MCALAFAALLGLATGCVQDAPTDLLAPADPTGSAPYRPPPSPLAGLKPYQPVEARADWGSAPPPTSSEAGKAAATMPGLKGKSTPGTSMPGMGMPGMDMGGKR